MANKASEYTVTIEKLVHGGQGIATLENGKRALVWGVLPGEKVIFATSKKRSDYVEGVVSKVIEASSDRIEPRDELYLSTSPWQIMSYERENEYKKDILSETMLREGVVYSPEIAFRAPTEQWHYRNKMEYSFWGDEAGLHVALFNRGTHHKQIVQGSSIARKEIDEVASKLCKVLDDAGIRAGDLKSVIIRCNQDGEVVCALFVRDQAFLEIDSLKNVCKGVVVCYSNPKSPASVRTKDLYTFGDISLSDDLLGKSIGYDVFSFFQISMPIFDMVLSEIVSVVGEDDCVDLYSGVGSIGLSLPSTKYLIETEANNAYWANKNAQSIGVEVVKSTSEKALDYIDDHHTLIVDPPRAGLHKDLVRHILEVKPPKIVYLSCNPSTHARDIKLLESQYRVTSITGYNFFPRTPHIESLAILVRK